MLVALRGECALAPEAGADRHDPKAGQLRRICRPHGNHPFSVIAARRAPGRIRSRSVPRSVLSCPFYVVIPIRSRAPLLEATRKYIMSLILRRNNPRQNGLCAMPIIACILGLLLKHRKIGADAVCAIGGSSCRQRAQRGAFQLHHLGAACIAAADEVGDPCRHRLWTCHRDPASLVFEFRSLCFVKVGLAFPQDR